MTAQVECASLASKSIVLLEWQKWNWRQQGWVLAKGPNPTEPTSVVVVVPWVVVLSPRVCLGPKQPGTSSTAWKEICADS